MPFPPVGGGTWGKYILLGPKKILLTRFHRYEIAIRPARANSKLIYIGAHAGLNEHTTVCKLFCKHVAIIFTDNEYMLCYLYWLHLYHLSLTRISLTPNSPHHREDFKTYFQCFQNFALRNQFSMKSYVYLLPTSVVELFKFNMVACKRNRNVDSISASLRVLE